MNYLLPCLGLPLCALSLLAGIAMLLAIEGSPEPVALQRAAGWLLIALPLLVPIALFASGTW
jgi:hypothetical protein